MVFDANRLQKWPDFITLANGGDVERPLLS
jgi:hypothetical protein